MINTLSFVGPGNSTYPLSLSHPRFVLEIKRNLVFLIRTQKAILETLKPSKSLSVQIPFISYDSE